MKSVLKAYVPNYKSELYDLTRFSDDQIKGAILSRIVLLLFKHITDADIVEKLPGIIALFDELLKEKSGLRNLETVLRYLAATVENVTSDEMKTVINSALTGGKKDIIMTLAEQWIQEGFQKGIHQGMQEGMQAGVREGLLEGIVLAVHLKFGVNPESDRLIQVIQKMRDLERIKTLKHAILKAHHISELVEIASE